MEKKKLIGAIISLIVVAFVFQLVRGYFSSENLNRRRYNPKYNPDYSQPSSSKSNSQDATTTAWIKDSADKSYCSLNTTGVSRAGKAKMKIYHPCYWRSYSGDINTVIIEQYSNVISPSLTIGMSVSAEYMEVLATPKLINKISSADYMKRVIKNDGFEYISSEPITLASTKVGQAICSKELDKNGAVGFYMRHFIYYQDAVLDITYFVASTSKQTAKKYFDMYISVFNRWLKRTEFL
jgi:hypothetical protein